MLAGSFLCHQIPERSPHLFGAQMPLCWRCTGILVGTIAFLCWLIKKRRLPALAWSLALACLMPIDVLTASMGLWHGANSMRFVTGALWGAFGTSVLLHFAWHAVTIWQSRAMDFRARLP